MKKCHHTAICPACGKDSYKSEFEALFTTVRCIWCNALFTYDEKTESFKVANKKRTKP